jgi:guanosine-3',5'-bis(diphosphate) 3'-pyrophosphohydrolase
LTRTPGSGGAGGLATLLDALRFSAVKHRDQRRKDRDASPYINHPIEVAHLLATTGGVTDVTALAAAVLHDTLEDTRTTPAELEERFGPSVRALVEAVTDDKRLPKDERKRRQIAHTAQLPPLAKLIKVADKIANVVDVTHTPPVGWSRERRLEYLAWTEQVVAGCRGTNAPLEQLYDQVLREGRAVLARG